MSTPDPGNQVQRSRRRAAGELMTYSDLPPTREWAPPTAEYETLCLQLLTVAARLTLDFIRDRDYVGVVVAVGWFVLEVCLRLAWFLMLATLALIAARTAMPPRVWIPALAWFLYGALKDCRFVGHEGPWPIGRRWG